jgi:hypothetical protein
LELVRSAETVENLLRGPADPDAGDAPLPPDLSQQALRPLAGLEPALACACWRLASRLGKPTGHVVGSIVRVVKKAIDEGQGNGSDVSQNESKRAQKAIFLSSVHRLAAGESFSPQIITMHIKDAVQAMRCMSSCKLLIARCEAVLRQLHYRFPEL